MSVEQMLHSMSSRELVEWEIFHHRIEPVGHTRLDWLFGLLAAMWSADKSKGIADFVIFPLKTAPEPTKRPNLLHAKIHLFFRQYEKSRGVKSRRAKRT